MTKDDPLPIVTGSLRRQDEILLPERQHVSANDTRGLHPTRDADDEHHQEKDPRFRAEGVTQRLPKQHDDDQQQRQQEQGLI